MTAAVVSSAGVVVGENAPPCVEHCSSDRHITNARLLRRQHTRGVAPTRQFVRPPAVVGHSELTSGASVVVVVTAVVVATGGVVVVVTIATVVVVVGVVTENTPP